MNADRNSRRNTIGCFESVFIIRSQRRREPASRTSRSLCVLGVLGGAVLGQLARVESVFLPRFPFLEIAPRLPEHTPQQELDLAVQAAQIVVCPALNGVEYVAVYAHEEGLPVRHGGLY